MILPCIYRTIGRSDFAGCLVVDDDSSVKLGICDIIRCGGEENINIYVIAHILDLSIFLFRFFLGGGGTFICIVKIPYHNRIKV